MNSLNARADSRLSLGTEDDPYVITSASDLINIFYNDATVYGYYKLGNDIDFYGSGWGPAAENFAGTLDGNGKSIKNMKIVVNAGGNYGLFRKLFGTVKNLTIDNLTMTSNLISSEEAVYAGAIAGYSDGGKIINCVVKNSYINLSKIQSLSYAGGFAGYSFYGKFENCSFGELNLSANTTVFGNCYAGGIFGFGHAGTATDCLNFGTVQCDYFEGGEPYAGGIAGAAYYKAKLKNCCNVGIIKYIGAKNSDKNFQPRMGQLLGSTVSNCEYNTEYQSDVGIVSSCRGQVDKGNLRKVGGFIGIGTTDQAKYVSDGCVGELD